MNKKRLAGFCKPSFNWFLHTPAWRLSVVISMSVMLYKNFVHANCFY